MFGFLSRSRRSPRLLGAIALAGALAACTTAGTGSGSSASDSAPVAFAWTSKDGGISGTMTATLADGTVLGGPFLQITAAARVESLSPMWVGWRRGWSDWTYWGPYPESAFVTRYSGRVVANLTGPGSKRLRCRFHLNAPASGMGGGGQGECQGLDGKIVSAVFEPK